MRGKITTAILSLFALSGSAQLVVDPTYNAQQLVDVIVVDGISVTNMVLNCAPGGSAYFDATATNLNMTTGVLLTSGTVANAAMNNNDPGASACNGTAGDPQVEGVANETTYDACILEFDMVPTCNQVNFNYVFGSDEYPEYINEEFADAMVITISGPGFVGQENIALIPGSPTPVGVNYVNSGANGAYYVNNNGGATIQYDGFTVPLTATANVTPCESYHVKIAVADAADCIFDSGLFVAENSMDCGASNSVTTDITVGPFQPIEGCRTYDIDLCRQGDITGAHTLNVTYGGTATNGVDFTLLPTVVNFPAGVQCQTITVEALADAMLEGAENIEFVYEAISGICLVYDTIDIQIIDDQNMNPDFYYNDVCLGNTVFFNNGTSITPPATVTDFVWKFGDGTQVTQYNASRLYANPGDYDVWMIATSGDNCVDSVMYTVHVYDFPVADFTTADICLGNAANFNNLSLPPSNDNMGNIQWNFGDGGSSNAWDAVHNYSIPDTFVVSLSVSSQTLSCTSTLSDTVIVYPPVYSDFTTGPVCFGDTVSFTNESVGGIAWEWNFGDGSAFANNFDTVHYYTAPGLYSVRLVGFSPNACNDTIIRQMTVFDAPQASFTTADICQNELGQFVNTTTLPTYGALGSWYWIFSDNTNSSAYSPLHLFPIPGVYTATLVVYNEMLGCSDTATTTITSYAVPESDFSVANVCDGLAIQPVNLSLNTASSWVWDFGDGSPTVSAAGPTYTYPQAGTYDLMMVANYNDQCSDTAIHAVTIYELPNPDFTWNYVCEGSATPFLNQSSVPFPENIINWVWNYGDGTPSETVINASHIYANGGAYNVSLQVTTGHGCTGGTSKPIWVNHAPSAAVSVSDPSGCPILCVDFSDQSQIPFGDIVSRKWNFGDFQLSFDSTITHCYTNEDFEESAFYNIRFEVESDSGCTSVLTLDSLIEIYPITHSDFGWTPDSVSTFDPRVYFIDKSYGNDQWEWDFGDTNQYSGSYLQNPEYTYTSHGYHDIYLIVDNEYGCSDTSMRTIYIYADMRFYAPNAFTPNVDGRNDEYRGYGSDIMEYQMRVFTRWGSLIFESNEIDFGWDGTVNGYPVEAGMYMYEFRLKDLNYNPYEYTGYFTLIR